MAPAMLGEEHLYRVLFYREGETTTTLVVEATDSGRRSLILDGFVTAADGTGTRYMPMMGHLPLLLHPNPLRALIICLATGSTARALASWPGVEFDVAEINADVLARAGHFGDSNGAVIRRTHLEDGRTFLLRTTHRYDVITLEPMPPYFAGAVNLYSLEDYRLARSRMTDDGILAQWLPLHLVAPRDSRQIRATLQAVFPATRLFVMPGDLTGLAIGSVVPIDVQRVRSHYASAPPTLRAMGFSADLLAGSFALGPEQVRRYTTGAPLVTDDRSRLEYSGLDRALGRFADSTALHRHNLSELSAAARETTSTDVGGGTQ